MKLHDQVNTKDLVEVKTLSADTYFAVVHYDSGVVVELGTPFLFDGKRYIRLCDAAFVDSFFKGSQGDTKVLPIDHSDAIDLALEYRRR